MAGLRARLTRGQVGGVVVDPERFERAERALERVRDEWLARRGVVAVEVGRRRRDGQPTDEVCIRVTVQEILPPDDVPDGELFPRFLGDVHVDVVEGAPPAPQATG